MKYKKIILASIILITLLVLIFFLNGRGRITIILPTTPESETIVTIYSSDSQNPKIVFLENQISSIQLKSGSYFLAIESDTGSYLRSVDVSGFMRATRVADFELKGQMGREFVIDEPADCFYPLKPSYVSYPCNGTLFGLSYHELSTESRPSTQTTVRTVFEERLDGEADSPDPGLIEGVFAHKDKTYLVVKNFEAFGRHHDLYRLEVNRGKFDIVFDRRLDFLPLDAQFSASSDGTTLKFVPESGSFLFTGANFDELQRKNVPAASVDASTLVDTNNGTNLYKGFLSEGPEDRQTILGGVIAVSTENTEKIVNTTSTLLKTEFCFTEHICTLEESGLLAVYTDDLNPRYTIQGVFAFTASGGELYMLDTTGVSRLSMTDFGLEGHYVYTSALKGYSLANINGEVYVSAQSPVGTHALLLSAGSGVAADRVLTPLLESVFVDAASINSGFVHLAVDLGERVIDEPSALFITDPEIQKAAGNEITKIIRENNIKSQGFTVISPRLTL